MAIQQYKLGCAVWSLDRWRGTLYTAETPKRQFLSAYASAFNAVEGNTTFYATPPVATVQNWLAQTPDDFRFCFKFPRLISHDQGLVGVASAVHTFLSAIAPLGPRLGPIFLQLPPTFTVSSLPQLTGFLEGLPTDFRYGVEVRHPSFFEPAHEARLCALLARHHVDRVILDARVLHHTESQDSWIQESKRRKPRLPIRTQATGQHPFVRIIGNDRPDDAGRCIAAWAQVVARWIDEGRTPYVFLHSPDDFHAPAMCRMFHRALQQHVPALGEMPRWPAEEQAEVQLELLGSASS